MSEIECDEMSPRHISDYPPSIPQCHLSTRYESKYGLGGKLCMSEIGSHRESH